MNSLNDSFRSFQNFDSIQRWIDFYKKVPINSGADLFCVGKDKKHERLVHLASTLFLNCFKGKIQFHIILPPQDTSDFGSNLLSSIKMNVKSFCEKNLYFCVLPVVFEEIEDFIVIHESKDLEADSLLSLLSQVKVPFLASIVETSRYRSRTLSIGTKQLFSVVEDLWVPHLYQITCDITNLAVKNNSYVLVDTGEFGPSGEKNHELLKSIQNCGLIVGKMKLEPREDVSKAFNKWSELMKGGDINVVLNAIDVMGDLGDLEKLQLKIETLRLGQRPTEALGLLSPNIINLTHSADCLTILGFSRIAAEGGDRKLGLILLDQAMPILDIEESFSLALIIAGQLNARNQKHIILEKYKKLFPRSMIIFDQCLADFINSMQYEKLEEFLISTTMLESDKISFHQIVSAGLKVKETPDYNTIIEQIEHLYPSYLEYGRFLFARDAFHRKLPEVGIKLVKQIAMSSEFAKKGIGLVLKNIEYQFLNNSSDEGILSNSNNLLSQISLIAEYLSENPSDSANRVDFVEILTVPSSGLAGTIILANSVIALVRDTRYVSLEMVVKSTADSAEFDDFMKQATTWVLSQNTIVIGQGKLPDFLIHNRNLEGIYTTFVSAFKDYTELCAQDANEFLLALVNLGVLISKEIQLSDSPFDLLNVACAYLVNCGRHQQARNLVECALLPEITMNSSFRKRLGLYTFADIYHRAGNSFEALVAINCALASRSTITLEQYCLELTLVARILRDLHLKTYALDTILIIKDKVKGTAIEGKYLNRLEVFELGVLLKELLSKNQSSAKEWQTFLERISSSYETVISSGDEIGPILSIYGQAIKHAELRKISIVESFREDLQEMLKNLPESLSKKIEIITSLKPSLESITGLLRNLESTLYSEDLGTDLEMITIAAQQLLSAEEVMLNSEIAIFCIELLCDLTVRHSELNLDTGVKSRLPKSKEDVSEFVKNFSKQGIGVHVLGKNSIQQLVRVSINDGQVMNPVVEDHSVFSSSSLLIWRQKYPYRYAFLDSSEAVLSNEFRMSVNQLGLSIPSGQPTLIISSSDLQEFPSNLFLLDNDFAGRTTPIATAPSITWLKNICLREHQVSGKKIAWVSTEKHEGSQGALQTVVERIEGALSEFGIELNTKAEVPADLKGADMVIVGAHGSLVSHEQRYFQTVSDEASLSIRGIRMARRLAGVEVVILFACSAGRMDSHPFSNATIGLPKLLLDNGCRVVIASPWPIDSRLPGYWLQPFLEASKKGADVLEATFIANSSVKKNFSDAPTHSLAMAVYGDPMVKIRW